MEFYLIILLIPLSFEICHENCEFCKELNYNFFNMKCISCIDGLNLIFNTTICDSKIYYPNYYLNITDNILYPCSLFENQNCYECNPYLETSGICLSCNKGYVFDNTTNECKKCNNNEIPIIKQNFYGCKRPFDLLSCNLFITYCNKSDNNEEIICPNDAPFFDKMSKSCNEYECQNKEKDLCLVQDQKYKNRILFINWFNNEPKYCNNPSYNVDNSGYLLIEISCNLELVNIHGISIDKKRKRKFYFFNEEGRGLFDEINDIYEKTIELDKKFYRFLSTSIALKVKDSNEYRYFLNFENFELNLEFLDIKTGEIDFDFIFNIFETNGISTGEYLIPSIQLMELNSKNQYLIASIIYSRSLKKYCLYYTFFEINTQKEKKFSIYFLNNINHDSACLNLEENSKFFFTQTKNGKISFSNINKNYYLKIYIFDPLTKEIINQITIAILFKNAFHKYINIKNEINLLCYYSDEFNNHNVLSILIFEITSNNKFQGIFGIELSTELLYGSYFDNSDLIFLTETKAIFIAKSFHGKKIQLFILNFFANYENIIVNLFNLNLSGLTLFDKTRYSLLFKYKGLLGLQIENTDRENGFILFGYFNSTDPKQIYDIKKDGLNYEINLQNYLNLQSNIFGYKIKYIKILEVPNITYSGIYLISNNTKNIINKDDCVDINTHISLNFVYNGKIKKGNYLFKFVGVLEELTFEEYQKYPDETMFDSSEDEQINKYIKEYNLRRNMNITGRVALVQINAINDIKVFCDGKYDNYSLKNEGGYYLTCRKGIFYDVYNDNEITQLNLGINYYFNNKINSYIKCHKRCKTCSRIYNSTNMNCDECFENFFIRNDNCLEIAKCDFNYYYDFEFNLKCIDRKFSCPDIKPYENNITKECIETCNFYEFNNICNPTNNLISINETRNKILENVNTINMSEKLIKNKQKYIIKGNNVTFIFSTSEIEEDAIYNNFNTSSIIISKEFAENLKKKYFIPYELPIPILKIETLNNHSNNLQISYELFNPTNLSNKLDFGSFSQKIIEIRIPMAFKSYKMDLIREARKLGYNIFDLNDPFYHDICSIFSYNNSDISLSERKNLLDLSDEELCMENCTHINFDIKTLKIICLCKIGDYNNNKTEIENKINKTINNDILEQITKDIAFSKTSNIKVIKCFNIIFNKNLFKKNYGFYIMFFMNCINIIILIFNPISKAEIKFNKFCDEVIIQFEEIQNKIILENEKKDEFNIINNTADIIQGNKNNKETNLLKIKKKIKRKSYIAKIVPLNLGTNSANNNSIYSLIKFKNDKSQTPNNNIIENDKKINDDLKNLKGLDLYIFNVIKYIDYEKRKNYLSEYEIENLSYKNALKIENRNKSDYYYALLKEKNKIISIFLNEQDYNIPQVKMSLFIFFFNLSMTINALFFTDEAIHEINQENGSFNLSTQISRVIYSAIISAVINFIVEFLAFSHKSIIKLRTYKDIKDALNEKNNLIKILKLKYILYFGLTIFFNILFLYYITAFCTVYSIIQIHMISDSLMSFLLTMSYSIVLSMISTIIRINSLKKKNKFRHFFYIISWIVSLI